MSGAVFDDFVQKTFGVMLRNLYGKTVIAGTIASTALRSWMRRGRSKAACPTTAFENRDFFGDGSALLVTSVLGRGTFRLRSITRSSSFFLARMISRGAWCARR